MDRFSTTEHSSNKVKETENRTRQFAPYAKFLRSDIKRVADLLKGDGLEENYIRSTIIKNLKESVAGWQPAANHPGYTNAAEIMWAQLEGSGLEGSSTEEWIDLLVSKFVGFVSDNFLVKDFENILQTEFNELAAYPDRLNNLLGYDVLGDTIDLHIFPRITNNPSELRSLAVNGFRLLAKKIKNSKEFDNIKSISGVSWIVEKNPQLVKRLGFEVKSQSGDSYAATAEIDRDKFLELYG